MKKLIFIIAFFLTQACNNSVIKLDYIPRNYKLYPLNTTEDIKIIYSGIDTIRNGLKLKHLRIDKTLETAAKDYAIKLAENRVFTHLLWGTTPKQRVNKYDKSFTVVLEILASRVPLESVVNAWMNSPGHKAAIINTNTSKIGGYRLKTSDNIVNIFVVLFGEKN